jgi:hypothetical protein
MGYPKSTSNKFAIVSSEILSVRSIRESTLQNFRGLQTSDLVSTIKN